MNGKSRKRTVLLGIFGLVLALCVAVVATGCAGGGNDAAQTDETQASDDATAPDQGSGADITSVDEDDPYASGVHHARIEVEGYGTIEVSLNANVAPITVSNFCHLVEEGFYDGLTFHRVVPGFMIQGGDPNGDGTGGSDETIKGEFEANGVENNIPHVRGTISMARATDYDSASSQFFIMQETNDSLDGQYAAFGSVTSGMEVVDAICEGVTIADEGSGLVTEDTQPVITSITLID